MRGRARCQRGAWIPGCPFSAPASRTPRSQTPSRRSGVWSLGARRAQRRGPTPQRPVPLFAGSFPAWRPSGLLIVRESRTAAERPHHPASRSEEDGAQDEVGHRTAEVPQTGWLQGRLDLCKLRRWREIPDLLGGCPARFAGLPDLRADLVYVVDDLRGGLPGVIACGPGEQRRLQGGRQKQCDPHHEGDHRRCQGAVAKQQRPVGHPGVETCGAYPEGRQYGQEQEQSKGQPRPVLRYGGKDPTRRMDGVDEEEIQVRGERDEHTREPEEVTRPGRSRNSPRLSVHIGSIQHPRDGPCDRSTPTLLKWCAIGHQLSALSWLNANR